MRRGSEDMKITVITQAVGESYKNLVKGGLITIEHWCRKHGYEFVLSEEEWGRPPAWGKVRLVQRHIDDCDWLFLIDSDVIITNPEISVEEILREHEGERFDILMTLMRGNLNTGAMLIKRSDWIKSFCDVWWDQEELIHHGWWEQAALIHLYNENYDHLKRRIHIIHPKWINSYVFEWKRGDFLAHFAGGGAKRGGRMDEWLQACKPEISFDSVIHRSDLPRLFNKLKFSKGLELGVLRGDFSAVLRHGWVGDLILVDCWEHQDSGYVDMSNKGQNIQDRDYQFVKERFSYFSDVQVLKAFSEDAAEVIEDNSLDWIYIDANHRYEECLRDLSLWYPKVKEGGIMSGHDYLDGHLSCGMFGVKSAVNEFVAKLGGFIGLYVTQESFPSWFFTK
jgi:hypothetical protein